MMTETGQTEYELLSEEAGICFILDLRSLQYALDMRKNLFK